MSCRCMLCLRKQSWLLLPTAVVLRRPQQAVIAHLYHFRWLSRSTALQVDLPIAQHPKVHHPRLHLAVYTQTPFWTQTCLQRQSTTTGSSSARTCLAQQWRKTFAASSRTVAKPPDAILVCSSACFPPHTTSGSWLYLPSGLDHRLFMSGQLWRSASPCVSELRAVLGSTHQPSAGLHARCLQWCRTDGCREDCACQACMMLCCHWCC